ncbi:MAG: hypothetical protein C4539_13310 [Ignavibacteriales bacterium]|jgi:hypothetical protein|nr:MAG: hypothetical protein C4539_13310 [Ignavibacteriales bacterium]
MALPSDYLYVYGQAPQLFERIKQGQAPEKFSQQHLKDIGFNSTNHRAFIPLLKTLGFLSPDGTPTQRYHDYRNNALSRKVLGEALKEAYSDIFKISAKPSDNDKELIQGKFKSTHNTSDRNAELMAKTFFALLELADLDSEVPPEKTEKKKDETKKESTTELKKEDTKTPPDKHIEKHFPSLNYNIQIHLPATKDVEVYNAIFKSLKEHLID